MIQLNDFLMELKLTAAYAGRWMTLPLIPSGAGWRVSHKGIEAELSLKPQAQQIDFTLAFTAAFSTRLRIELTLPDADDVFHLIPGNIFGDNNAAHVRPGEFPVLATDRLHERNRAPLWEFRADRASHPVSILCCQRGAVGISIDPYSTDEAADDGFIRNGVFSALPNKLGVSLGYGNDPLTFNEKTFFLPATCNLSRGATASGSIFAVPGDRRAAHQIIRHLYEKLREKPAFTKTYSEALRALADAFAHISYVPEIKQYTNQKALVPTAPQLKPWRAIVEIGWTGGAMMAYPFALAERIFPDLRLPKSSTQMFDEIVAGLNPASGLINDTAINRYTENRPVGWNESELNGWWSGFLPNTCDAHCAYTNAHAAYYLLKTDAANSVWRAAALRVLDTTIELQRKDGALGYLFSSNEKRVIDFDGFAGCWFAPAMILAWKQSGAERYLQAARRAVDYYAPFVQQLNCWGSPMDTFKSVDSEGNLAFMRATCMLHEATGETRYLELLTDGAHYEYLWRYGFRTRPQCPPLRGSSWNSCGGTITSVSNPHIHPMGVVATRDLEYLAAQTGDRYHRHRADDGMAWLMNTMELYPEVTGYGRYGVLSERTCPSDGLLSEHYEDDGSPASTWWSYNAWAAASAMEALGEALTVAKTSNI